MWRVEKLVKKKLNCMESCILDRVNKGVVGSKGRMVKPVEEAEERAWFYFNVSMPG